MGEPVKILLIEDSLADAKLLLQQLAGDSFQAQHVMTLAEALAYEGGHADGIDVIVSDLRLPDSPARETMDQLSQLAKRHPVVVLTAVEDESLGKRSIDHGVEDYVMKGADPAVLRRSIAYAMGRHQLKRDLRSVVEKNADAVIVVGLDGTVRFGNSAAEVLFGRSADSWVGEPFGFEIPERSVVLVDLPRGEEVRTVEMRTTDVRWSDEDCFLLSVRDVTDRMRAQELERQLMHADRLASIGQLAAGVAHEVNNPLTFISSNLELLERRIVSLRQHPGTPPDQLDEMQQLVRESAVGLERMGAFVRGLKSFGRVGVGAVVMTDLNEIVEEACTLTRGELRHRAELVKDLSPVPPLAVERGELAQVFVNLLINAAQGIEAAGSGREHRVTVTTRLRPRGRDEQEILVRIEDTGCGIAEEHVVDIFNAFFTTKEHGTGLGLSISADAVRKHRGHIEVCSELGRGTRFDIVLPLDTRLSPTVSPPPIAPRERARRLSILLVDDQQLVRRAIKRSLRDHEVEDVASAEGALRVLERGARFDAIVCDVMMPQIDGVTFYREVARRFPEQASRFVFVSGGAFTSEVRSFLAGTAAPVVEKPIDRALLRAALAQVSEG